LIIRATVGKETMEKQEEHKTFGHLAKLHYHSLYFDVVLPIHVTGKVDLTTAITAAQTN